MKEKKNKKKKKRAEETTMGSPNVYRGGVREREKDVKGKEKVEGRKISTR